MNTTSQLWIYFLLVFGVIILPGMDMAFVLGSSISGGRRSGMAAVAGMVAGGICHMIIGATGISVVLNLYPAAFNTLLFGGALYIAWIGWSMIRVKSLNTPTLATGRRSMQQSFLRAMATCLLNPKAYMFMLAVFPQFVDAARGSIWAQAAVLSLITAATQIAIYGGLALTASRAYTALETRPDLNAWLAKTVGMVLIGAALLTLCSGIKGWHANVTVAENAACIRHSA
jgi:threonine/homoserine/homoserine lactone efflux protein